MRKTVDFRNKGLQCIPPNLKSDCSIESADFSSNPLLTSFRDLPSFDFLKKLYIDHTQINTFKCAPVLPSLEVFSCRNSPLGQHDYLDLMAALVFNDGIRVVNGNKVAVNVHSLASANFVEFRKYLTDGNIIINLNPLKMINPETRRRKTVFVNFSCYFDETPIPIQKDPETQSNQQSHIPTSTSRAKGVKSSTAISKTNSKIPSRHTNSATKTSINSSKLSTAGANSSRASKASNTQYQKDSFCVSSTQLQQKKEKAKKQEKEAETQKLRQRYMEISKSLWRETVLDRENSSRDKKHHKKDSNETFYAKSKLNKDEPFIIEIEEYENVSDQRVNEDPIITNTEGSDNDENTLDEHIHKEPHNEENIHEAPHNEEDVNKEMHNEEDIYEAPHNEEDIHNEPHNEEEDIYNEPHNDEEDVNKEMHNEEDIYEAPHNEGEDIHNEPHNEENIHEAPHNEEDIHNEPHNEEEDIYNEPHNEEEDVNTEMLNEEEDINKEMHKEEEDILNEPHNDNIPTESPEKGIRKSSSPSPHKKTLVPNSPGSYEDADYYSYYSDDE